MSAPERPDTELATIASHALLRATVELDKTIAALLRLSTLLADMVALERQSQDLSISRDPVDPRDGRDLDDLTRTSDHPDH